MISITLALLYNLKSGIVLSPWFFMVILLFRMVLIILGFWFFFHMKLRIVLLHFIKILLKFWHISLNLFVAFGKMAIFTMLILLIHGHGGDFHLLISSQYLSSDIFSFSFFKDLKFYQIHLWLTYLKLPQLFYIFMAIINDVISLITFSAHLSFVYWRTTDFLELICI